MEDQFGIPKGPNSQFWFGADAPGRDLFVRVMYGARTSLIVGIGASAIAVFIGLIVGMVAGFYGGWVDTALSRTADVMLSLPQILIAVGVVAACSLSKNGCLGGLLQPGLPIVIVVIAFFSWSYIARIVRGYTLSLREKEFVESARALGAGNAQDPRLGNPPEPDRAARRLHDAADPDEHPLRSSTVIPGSRRARDDIFVGLDPRRCNQSLRRRLVVDGVSRRLPDPHDPGVQPARRRSARRVRRAFRPLT